jgi:hypothetical protein
MYLDMHPRAHKYKHAAQFTVCDGVEGVQRPDGALVTNLPRGGRWIRRLVLLGLRIAFWGGVAAVPCLFGAS